MLCAHVWALSAAKLVFCKVRGLVGGGGGGGGEGGAVLGRPRSFVGSFRALLTQDPSLRGLLVVSVVRGRTFPRCLGFRPAASLLARGEVRASFVLQCSGVVGV